MGKNEERDEETQRESANTVEHTRARSRGRASKAAVKQPAINTP